MAQALRRKFGWAQFHAASERLFDNIVTLGALAYLFLSIFQALDNPRTSYTAVTILSLNGVGALIGLRIAIQRSYLLYGVFFIFNFLFLAVAPLQQIGNNFDTIFSNLDLLDQAAALSAFMTAVGLCFVVYRAFHSLRPRHDGFLNRSLSAGPGPNYVFLAILSLTLSLGVIAYLGSGLFQMNREAYSNELSGKTVTIIMNGFFRPFALVAPLIGLIVAWARKEKSWVLVFGGLLLLGLLINNPLISARFRSSALIVFCILSVFGPQRVRLFLLVYLAGLLASPVIGTMFRYKSTYADQRTFSQFFVNVDFSGLDIFCYAILWADLKGFEYGSNIVGAVLFFVPRSLWEEKGRTVGEIMREYIFTLKGFGTDNVSAPPPVEGYFSFGIIGSLLISLAVVFVIDRIERRGLQAEERSPLYFILCLSPMLCMILLRGPFQVGVSEWVMHSSTILFSAFVLSLRLLRTRKRIDLTRDRPHSSSLTESLAR